MTAIAYTVAFDGIEARLVEVQCAVAPGIPSFSVVGLPDKAVSEARERIRAAFAGMNLALPQKRIVVNLSPADLPKAGSHFDLPIALAVLGACGAIGREELASVVALGELSLDGRLVAVAGALPATLAAAEDGRALMCPRACGAEAAWAEAVTVLAPATLREAVDHLAGRAPLTPARPGEVAAPPAGDDLVHVRGQERVKRALEIAAAGRHHMLMVGPPGGGKSMIARCMPGLLPPLTPAEALETAMIHSLAGALSDKGIARGAPFRDPHSNVSVAALVGGGRNAAPGEVSLAHNGVLFLDELPEFPRAALETLRQPIESGEIAVARANAHVRYPCRFLLLAAANPCRCGHLADAARACAKAPACGEDYLGRISGPLLDRFDLRIEVSAVPIGDMAGPAAGEETARVAARVADARARQAARYAGADGVRLNGDAPPALLEAVAAPDGEGRALLGRAAERIGLSGRGYHRVLRTARTIADLAGSEAVAAAHVAEALSYRSTLLAA